MSWQQTFRVAPRILTLVSLFCLSLIPVSLAQAQVSIAWATRYGAPGLVADPVAIASDAQGNIYAVASVDLSGSAHHREALTIKYDPNGNIVWKAWLGSSQHPSQAQAIGLDSDGNVYVLAATGLTTSPSTTIANSEFTTAKYNSSGTRQWVRYVAPPPGGDNFPSKMAVTAQGTVYVAGTSSPANNANSQVLTIKYDAAGNTLWSRLNPGPAAGTNRPSGFGLDATENVYIAVSSSHFYPTIYKLDSAGNLRGTFTSQALGNFNAFYVDAVGNLYAAGCYAPGPVAIKFDSNGNEVWRRPFTPTRCFSGIQVDAHGNVVIAETLGSSNTRMALVSLDMNGNLQWENVVGSGFSTALAIDSFDQIYLTGSTQGTAIALKYTASGQQLWVQQYADRPSSNVFTRAATLAVDNRLIITATSIQPNPSDVEFDWITLALSQNTP